MAEQERKAPDEEQIAGMLSAFRPKPSARFSRQMENAPWRRASTKRNIFPAFIRFTPSRTLAVLALLILAATGAMIYSPLRAVARQFMYFFLPAPSNFSSVEVTIQPSEIMGGLGTPIVFPLTLAEAEQAAGYPLKGLSEIPEGLDFTGAQYNPALQSVTLRYTSRTHILLFTQRPAGIEEYSSIGASAPVETVEVRGFSGEYVTGGWVARTGEEQSLQTAAPGTQVSLDIVWDPALPQQILRWEEGGMLFEILSSGGNLYRADLLELAEGLR